MYSRLKEISKMEIIIAIAIVVLGVAVWFNRKPKANSLTEEIKADLAKVEAVVVEEAKAVEAKVVEEVKVVKAKAKAGATKAKTAAKTAVKKATTRKKTTTK